VAPLGQLNGQFSRTGFDQAFFCVGLGGLAGFILLFAKAVVDRHRQFGWGESTELGAGYITAALGLFVYLFSLVGLRYVFKFGVVSAFNTWGRLIWSEDLTGLVDVKILRGRGTSYMRLIWADHKQQLTLFRSLETALEEAASITNERAQRMREERVDASDPDPGPPWTCSACHEENPGNFEECWKCQRLRADGEVPA